MRRRLATVAGGTALAIGLSAFGVIANGDAPTAAAAPAPTPASSGPTNTVTLLTGDRVTVGPDGTIVRIQRGTGRADVSFTSSQDPTGTYVIPSDAIDLVADGRLDRELFDVRGLAEAGYDALDRQAAPVIVTYEDRARTADLLADAGAVDRRRLDTIDAVAVRPGPGTELWAALTDDGRLAYAVDKIWLDGVRQPMLDRSTKQIGAPKAWDRGLDGAGVDIAVLDSGVDRTHPDLAERVSVARNFTDERPRDRVGHGTHVASIIAGTGAASDQTYRGVAPAANLISGKVCEHVHAQLVPSRREHW